MLVSLWFQLTPEYEGAGAIFVMLLTLYMIHRPAVRWLGRFGWVRWLFARRATRAAWAVRVVLMAAIVGAGCVPVTYHTGGPFELLPAARVVVRTEVAGPIETVFVREGQWVEAGQPLMQIAKRAFETNLARAEGEMRKAESRLALLKSGARAEAIESAREAVRTAQTRLSYSEGRLRRFEAMKAEELVSAQLYENAVAERDRSAAMVAEAAADLDLVLSDARDEAIAARVAETDSVRALVEGCRRDLEHATITSPIAGRVVTPRIESLAGVYVSPGLRDAVAQIEDAREVRAEVRVPEREAGLIRPGARVLLAAWAFHDRTFEGEVAGIAPVAAIPAPGAPITNVEAGPVQVVETADDEAAVRVLTALPNPDGRLQAGLTGYAKIEVARRPLWDILFRPVGRWFEVEFWSWLP
jgi:multidrug resistance efflux pump